MRTKHLIQTAGASRIVNSDQMGIGDIARILEGGRTGSTLMRTAKGHVLLDDPSTTWTPATGAFTVEIYPDGTELNLWIGLGVKTEGV